MELVSLYLLTDYESTFKQVKQLWNEKGITVTPEMATLIERHGLTRHDYKSLRNITDFVTIKEFYKYFLVTLLYAIDVQSFEAIDNLFLLERSVMNDLGR